MDDKAYEGKISALCGLNYKDGDEFGLYDEEVPAVANTVWGIHTQDDNVFLKMMLSQ